MALNDLTNQNIQDTYQKVIQTDGVNIANGTGSLLPISFDGNNVIISGSLTAQTYVVSESIVAVTSGSTMFGNSADDTHTFEGAITASGDISASGDLYSANVYIPEAGDIVWGVSEDNKNRIECSGNPEDIKIYTDRHLYLNPDSNLIISEGGTTYATFNGDDRGFSITGTITASGDISSSGELIGIIDGGSF